MGGKENPARLAGIVADRLSLLLIDGPVGGRSCTDLSALLDVLELFVPQVLRREFREWETESLDGFFIAEVGQSSDRTVSLVGLTILVSDQSLTPFHVGLHLATDSSLECADILLGERGGGVLGISGPICTAASVPSLLEGLPLRLSHLDWVYRATYVGPDSNNSSQTGPR